MSEIRRHGDAPPDLKQPVTRNSGTMRSTPAGGELSRDQYQRPVPRRQGGQADDS